MQWDPEREEIVWRRVLVSHQYPAAALLTVSEALERV